MKIRPFLSALLFVGSLVLLLAGCANGKQEDRDYFTSGSREADQRAEQRIAQTQQLRGEGETSQDEGEVNAKPSLYVRLGGEEGIQAIVDDFIARALADPRVNWERKGIESGGVLGFRAKSMEWKASPENLARLKKHVAQFLALSTGGPAVYEGRDMKSVHQGMKITNTEFDASVGDLKATLDKLRIPTDEQTELLAIIETTRPQVAEER